MVDQEGNEIIVEKETWNNVKYAIDPETQEITETISGTFSQYPLKTAWAITIHKSQGLTFEHAIIDASAAFSHGQVYVALSRCKTLEGLVLSSPITRNAMINDYRIQEFTSSVGNRQPGEEQMQAAQQLYFMELICELFDFNNLQQRIQYAAFVVYGNLQKLFPELSVQYSNTRDAFRSTVTDVGERFIQQLKRMITGNPDYLKDEMIQERVRKGVSYFLEQIDRLCTPLQEASDVEIDNKETRKTVKSALDKWDEDLRIKLAALEGCKDQFTISGYLSAKAKASIEQTQTPTRKRTEKSAKQEKEVISTDIKYPELYASQLEENESMRKSIKEALEQQLPSLAECGGFMYLHDTLTDREGTTYQMAGVIPAECQYTGKLVRFGYVEVQLPQGLTEKGTAERPEPEKIKAHEFHYFDSTANGEDCIATKPVTGRSWKCIHASDDHFWGFPHLYYPSDPKFVKWFLERTEKHI